MCGIVGAVSVSTAGTPPADVVLDGLARLEYRGYDSAGIAIHSSGKNGGLKTVKAAGRVRVPVDFTLGG